MSRFHHYPDRDGNDQRDLDDLEPPDDAFVDDGDDQVDDDLVDLEDDPVDDTELLEEPIDLDEEDEEPPP